jgi:hypothetical protein
MQRVIIHAVRAAGGLKGPSPFEIWKQLYQAQANWGVNENLPPLLTHFGSSLVERALLDATCRSVGRPFTEVLRTNALGIRLGDVHAHFNDATPADFLPERALSQLLVRHTVGLADPLTDADIARPDRLADGLPQSLAACIRAYGLRHFKIKVNGNLDHDLPRLSRVAEVLDAEAPADYAFSLDGNEQFRTLAAFQAYWQDLTGRPGLRRFWSHLLFVEQPFHRDVALSDAAVGGLKDWQDRPPIIIDESDAELGSAWQALRLGYAGTSHKNCKGVFKSVMNACLFAALCREQPGWRLIQSGEDLANIGPVALLQDLAVCAALGIESVERNGHHYFAGLSMFPAEVQRQLLHAHGDLYHPSRDGWPTLHIQNGAVSLQSVHDAPFGVGFDPDVELFTPVAL